MPIAPNTPPVALVSLSIRDFRGIASLDLDFRGPDGQPNQLVVLAGPNGCGKTAVLESALILAGGQQLAVGRRGQKAIRRGANAYLIQADFELRSGFLEPELLHRSDFPDTHDQHRLLSPPATPYWYFSSWRAPIMVGSVDVSVGRPGRKRVKNDANRLLNVKQQLANSAAVERFQAGHPSGIPSYSQTMNSVNHAWREFYPESSGEFFVDLVTEGDDGGGAFDVYLGTPDRDRLEVDFLSAGQLELFLFLAALALNKGREGIVFIDEPELHLDPQWHRPILRSLVRMQPRAQFIVATHSPEMYDAARSYERHFLVPESDPRARLWNKADGVGAGV